MAGRSKARHVDADLGHDHVCADIAQVRTTQWLSDFDFVYDQIKPNYDIRDGDLSHLVAAALHNGGAVSKNNRKKYIERVPTETLDAIEALCLSLVEGSGTRTNDEAQVSSHPILNRP